MRRCSAIFGDRGSGKTTTLACKILDEAQKDSAILVCCPEPQLIELLVAHLSAMGLENRIILDYADPRRADGKFPQWPLIQWSTSDVQLVRDNENEMYLDHFINLGFTTRQVKDGSLKPYTYKYAKLGGMVMQGLPGVPARMMKHLFRLDDPIGLWMIDNTTRQDAANEIRAAQDRGRGRGGNYDAEVGATERLYAFLDLVPLWTHDGNTFSWKSVIRKKMIYLLDLSGVSTAARRTLGMSAYTNAIHAMRELFDETGEAHDFLLALDEFGALDWLTPFLITTVQEDRKRGFKAFLSTQTINDVQPEEIREQILALTDHLWHHMSAGTDRAAQDICDKIFDAHKVLDQRERQMNDGVEEIRTKTTSENTGETLLHIPGYKKNKSKSRSEQEHVHFQTKFKTVVDKTFMTPNVQQAEIKTEVATQGVGQFYFVGFHSVSQQTTVQPGEPWILGNEFLPSRGMTLYEVRLEEAINRIRSRKIYQPPREWQLPSTPAGQGMR
jgi:hypothetical protein